MKFVLKRNKEICSAVEKMSVRELLETVICPQCSVSEKDLNIKSPFIFIHGAEKGKMEILMEHINDYQKKNTYQKKPIYVGDVECGAGCTVFTDEYPQFPSFAAIAREGGDASYCVARTSAEKLYDMGYRYFLAPCCDIIKEPDSPMGSTRSAGDTPKKVISVTKGYVKGIIDGGAACAVKHFPGDGFSDLDQHLTTSLNPMSEKKWFSTYGKIYSELIEAGAQTVMVGHISLPSFDEPDENGMYPPATLSKNLITGLLKEKLGFKGLVISDAVNMGGFAGYMNYYSGLARYLVAGGDIILFGRNDEISYAELEKRVESGELPINILKDRAINVLSFHHYLMTKKPVEDGYKEDDKALCDKVIKDSVEIFRDRNNILPMRLNRNSKILYTEIIADNVMIKSSADKFRTELKKRFDNVNYVDKPGFDGMFHMVRDGNYDVVICFCGNKCSFATGTVRMVGNSARALMGGWTKLGTPCIFIDAWHPYIHLEFETVMDTIVYSYGFADGTEKAILDKIFPNSKR